MNTYLVDKTKLLGSHFGEMINPREWKITKVFMYVWISYSREGEIKNELHRTILGGERIAEKLLTIPWFFFTRETWSNQFLFALNKWWWILDIVVPLCASTCHYSYFFYPYFT